MKKIALIYNTLGHPELPYETALRKALLRQNEGQLEFLVYSCTPQDRDVLPEDQLLYTSTRMNTLKRWMKYALLHPHKWILFLKERKSKNKLTAIITLWAKFAPLIAKDPDMVHLMTAAYYPKFEDVINPSKMVVSFRGADIVLLPMYTPKWAELIRDHLFPKVACAHFVSNYLRDEGLKWGGRLENSKVIRIGVDPDILTHAKKDVFAGSTKTILTAMGRLTWQKGFVYAIQAVAILKERGYSIQLNIIGQGDSLSELYYWRRLLHLEDEVNILGFLNSNEKYDYLKSSDIYIQPSVTEGLCVTIMEAMAMGLPVIASEIGGIPESIVNRETGILVPPANADALADAIIELITSKDLMKQMGEAGRKRLVDNFSLDQEAHEWLAFYSTLPV